MVRFGQLRQSNGSTERQELRTHHWLQYNVVEFANTFFDRGRSAKQVRDSFIVQKLALDAVQEVRIRLKWDALDKENSKITKAKVNKAPFVFKEFSNGDTTKQLLTRSRFLLHKNRNKCSES
jgi:hypothetical protein